MGATDVRTLVGQAAGGTQVIGGGVDAGGGHGFFISGSLLVSRGG